MAQGRQGLIRSPWGEVDFVIRPEEVRVIREGEPVEESLKGNIFEGEIRTIIERKTYHTLLLREVGKGVIFEANVPKYVFRNVKLVENQRVRTTLRRKYLCIYLI